MTVYNTDALREALDKYTRAYYRAQCSYIFERSGSIERDQRKLLTEVNADREDFDLEPLPTPEHWIEEDG